MERPKHDLQSTSRDTTESTVYKRRHEAGKAHPGNITGATEEDEARQQESCKEKDTGTVIESERRELPSEMTERPEEGAEEPPGGHHLQRGRPRRPTESGGNIKGTLHYNAETETWQCAQRAKYTAKEARGAETHESSHKERICDEDNNKNCIPSRKSHRNTGAERIRTLLQYGNGEERNSKTP